MTEQQNVIEMTTEEAKQSLLSLIPSRLPTFLWGPPGVGKSAIVRQAAAELNMGLVDVRLADRDPADVRGLPEPTGDGRMRWMVPEEYPQDDAPYVLFLDEYAQSSATMQSIARQFWLERKVGGYRLPANVSVVAAGNRQADRAATQRMPSHVANSLVHIEVSVDVAEWKRWALRSGGIAPEVVAFISFRPALLHAHDPKSTEHAFPTPRAWEFVSRILAASPPDALSHRLYAGTVGAGAASELSGFLRIFRELPDPDMVLANPKQAAIPEKPAVMYALCGAIASRAEAANMNAVVTLCERLPAEYSVSLMSDVISRDNTLQTTKAFVRWASAHQDVLF